MRAAIYARVSTLSGQSPEMQLAELREYASRRGWQIFGEYVDSGISGSKESRPELNRLMADAHRRHFDVVLCWNLPDYLDESLVKPVVGRLWSVLKPGGMMLAFFHTRDAGPDAPCYRYHIMGPDVLDMQPIIPQREVRRGPTGAVHRAVGGGFRLQRVFNNRHIENLFRDFASIKFFLSRDNIREVLVVR